MTHEKRLRIVTYNLQKGHSAARYASLDRLADALAERQPDIVTCQEVFHGHQDLRHQCEQLAEVLAHDHTFGPNAFYKRGCHGNATFTGHPIDRHENHNVTQSPLEKRGILQTWLRIGNLEVVSFNCHFSLTAGQRRKQWQQLSTLLASTRKTPSIICGDFNDWTGELDRKIRREGFLQGALWDLPRPQQRTFPARRPIFALDRVYYRGLQLRSVQVLDGTNWRRLSDHLPIEAEFEF